METFAQIAKALNRSNVEVAGLQSRFDLPVFPGADYPAPYLAFLRMVVQLRALNVSEEKLRELWNLKKKLLQLLHVDSTGSLTWFLDSCNRSIPIISRLEIKIIPPERSLFLSENFRHFSPTAG